MLPDLTIRLSNNDRLISPYDQSLKLREQRHEGTFIQISP